MVLPFQRARNKMTCMPSMQMRFPFPQNPEDLESLCLRLYREHWNVPNLQKYARRGQRQSGGDLLGTDDQGRICFIQCKHRDFDRGLSESEVRREVEAAKGFELKVERFAIATTAKRDPELQKLAAAITRENLAGGLFSVEIDSWDDLIEILNEHPDVAGTVYEPFRPGGEQEMIGGWKQGSQTSLCSTPATSSTQTLAADEPADIHSEIDEAGSYLTRGDLAVAEVLLDRIEKREGGRFTPRCRYRVLANRGHIRRLRGQFADAGRLYLQAKEYQPEDPAARWIEVLGLALLEDADKAAELAEKLVADHPSFPRGWALFASTRPKGVPFDEVEASIPEPMRGDAEVAMALADQAATHERWADCERYARLAVSLTPDWRDAEAQLAIAVVAQCRQDVLRSKTHQVVPEARTKLEEAKDLLQRAIDGSPAYLPRTNLAVLMLDLAAAYEFLGMPEDATRAVISARSMAPGQVDVERAYAVHLARQGDLSGAIDILTKAFEGGYSTPIALLLAQVLSQRNQGGDQEKVIGLLDLDESRAEQLASDPLALRSEWVCMLVRLRLAQHKPAGLDILLNTTPGSWLRPEERTIFLAAWSLESGDAVGASRQAGQIVQSLSPDTHPVAVHQLALVLRALGNYNGATKALRQIVQLDHVDGETDMLFDSAMRAHRIDLVLEYARELRANGCFNAKYIRHEILLLSQVSPAAAVDVLVDLLQREVDIVLKRECRAVLSYLARILGDNHLIETRPQELPAVADLPEAKLGRVVVEVLRHGPDPAAGMVYAYELYRRFPGELDAHMAVVNSFNMDIGRDFTPDIPTEANPGAAVRYSDDDSGDEHWIVIEDSDRPDVSKDEHAPSDPLCTAMSGKTMGEQFVLRAQPRRTGTILDITSKYVYRFRHCLGDMEARFSGHAPVMEFHVPKMPDGTPDVSVFVDQMKEIGGRSERILDAYRNGPFPLHAAAALLGVTVFELAQRVAYDPTVKVRCCVGNRQEEERAFSVMRVANAFVVDITAVATLAVLEAQGACTIRALLTSLPDKPIISEHALLELRRLCDARFSRSGEQTFVGSEGGRLICSTLSAEEMERTRKTLQGLHEVLRECCSVEPGTDLARYMHSDQEDLMSMLGNAGLHAMLLAAKPGHILWTDDGVAAQIAAERFGVNRTWTQAMLRWLEQAGRIPKAVQEEATLVLVRADYVFTGLNHEHVLRAMEHEGWDLDSPRLKPILAHFGERSVDPPARFALATATLKAIWQRGVLGSHTTTATFRILGALAADTTGRGIIEAIDSHVDQVFGVDVVNAQGLKQTIAAWKAAEGGILRP